jgi:hypothetical protein
VSPSQFYANPGRYVAFDPKLAEACAEWGRVGEWPEMSFVTLATGIWGRYHGRATP